MATVKVKTTQNVFIDYELAGLKDRIFAHLLDILVMGSYAFAVLFVIIRYITPSTALIIGTVGIPLFFYHLISELVLDGQSIGKKQMRVKVVMLDGGQPDIAAYLLRWIFRPVDFWISPAVAILTILIGGKGQRLGDLIAGTTVIKLQAVKRDIKSPLQLLVEEETYQPVYPQATNLSDQDIRLIKEALEVYRQSGNKNPVQLVAQKTEEILEVETEDPPVKFLNMVIRDFNFYTSRVFE